MKPVIVTTEFRGVFFGYADNMEKLPAEITLTDARNVIYWSSDVTGFLGLATRGPIGIDTRIGAKVRELTLYKITSVAAVEPAALEVWERL